MTSFKLPPAIADLVLARNKVRQYYSSILRGNEHKTNLDFTLDGNLVGDIGEAIAVELFRIRLVDSKSFPGIDGHAKDGRTVQVKATGTNRGPVFRQTQERADHLLFFGLDFEKCTGEILYNGPEATVLATLPQKWTGQRMVSRKKVMQLNLLLPKTDRLTRYTSPAAALD